MRTVALRLLSTVSLVLGAACGSSSPAAEPSPPLRFSPVPAPSVSVSASPTGTPLPNVRYTSLTLARKALANLKLHVKVLRKETIEWQPDTVLAQVPKAGTRVLAGRLITLTVAFAPACDPSYPTLCLTPFVHYDCTDFLQRNFPVLEPDPKHLDVDDDGIGCETHHK